MSGKGGADVACAWIQTSDRPWISTSKMVLEYSRDYDEKRPDGMVLSLRDWLFVYLVMNWTLLYAKLIFLHMEELHFPFPLIYTHLYRFHSAASCGNIFYFVGCCTLWSLHEDQAPLSALCKGVRYRRVCYTLCDGTSHDKWLASYLGFLWLFLLLLHCLPREKVD